MTRAPRGAWWRQAEEKWRVADAALQGARGPLSLDVARAIKGKIIGRCGYCQHFRVCSCCPLFSVKLCRNQQRGRDPGWPAFWRIYGHLSRRENGMRPEHSLDEIRKDARAIHNFILEDGKQRGFKEGV